MATSPIRIHAHGLAETESPAYAGPVIDAHPMLRAALSVDTPRMARVRAACRTGATPRPHDWRDFSGVEETLSKLGEVEFTAVAPESEPTTDQRVVDTDDDVQIP